MAFLTTQQSLPGGVNEMGTSGLRRSVNEQRVQTAPRTVNDPLAKSSGLRILIRDKPLLERR